MKRECVGVSLSVPSALLTSDKWPDGRKQGSVDGGSCVLPGSAIIPATDVHCAGSLDPRRAGGSRAGGGLERVTEGGECCLACSTSVRGRLRRHPLRPPFPVASARRSRHPHPSNEMNRTAWQPVSQALSRPKRSLSASHHDVTLDGRCPARGSVAVRESI